MHLGLLLDIMVKFPSCEEVLLKVAVVVISLTNFLVDFVSLLALFPSELLFLDPLDPFNIRLLSLHPASVVADYVLV